MGNERKEADETASKGAETTDKSGAESAEKRTLDFPGEATDQKVRGSNPLILLSDKTISPSNKQKLRQTRRRTQAHLSPAKDDNAVWRNFCSLLG